MGKHGDQLRSAMKRSRTNAEKAFVDTLLDTHTRIIDDTPVDKGFLRANHQISVGQDLTTSIDGTNPQTAKFAVELSDFEWGQTVWFVNNLPYARRREFEGGKTAPAGMMRRNVGTFNKRLQTAVSFYSGGSA